MGNETAWSPGHTGTLNQVAIRQLVGTRGRNRPVRPALFCAMPDHTWTFSDLARQVSCVLGTPAAFAIACGVVLLWAIAGPLFGYSDTWQLVINTGTTIVTFLMIFLVQHTQNP